MSERFPFQDKKTLIISKFKRNLDKAKVDYPDELKIIL